MATKETDVALLQASLEHAHARIQALEVRLDMAERHAGTRPGRQPDFAQRDMIARAVAANQAHRRAV
jgi:hypothetical protein